MQTAMIIGNIGQDPDMRFSQTGTPLLRFSVASNERRRGQDGEYSDETTWFRVTIAGQRAESLNQYLKKGMRVFVSGRLSARPWVSDRDNSLNAGLEIFAERVEFVSTREQDESRQNSGGGYPAQGNGSGGGYGLQGRSGGGQQQAARPQQQQATHPAQQTHQQGGFDDGDLEDLPF